LEEIRGADRICYPLRQFLSIESFNKSKGVDNKENKRKKGQVQCVIDSSAQRFPSPEALLPRLLDGLEKTQTSFVVGHERER
jgi:hypothetical protein